MTFSIKHIPNGITPYNEDRYERKPQYPTEEDEIIIKCVAVNCDDSTQIKLYLKINGMEKALHPEKKMDLEKSEMNCEFEIGKTKLSDKVSYYFEGQCHNERTRTKEYRFATHKWLNGMKVDAVNYTDNCIIGYLKYEKKLAIVIYFKNSMLNMVVCDAKYVSQHIGDASTFKQIKDEVYQFKDKDSLCYLELLKDSFEFFIKNSNNDVILKSNVDNLKIRMDCDHDISSIEWTHETASKEFFGLGERYDSLNQKGKSPDIRVFEEFTNQKEKTYMPVPFFMTEQEYGVYIDTTYHSYFDLCKEKENRMSIRCDVNSQNLHVGYKIIFGTPKKMLQQYYQITGYPKLPPKWAFGPWMSSNRWNTQEETLKQLEHAKQYDIPATVLVLEAWSDEITFYSFNDAKYKKVDGENHVSYLDYSFTEAGKWENPKEMIDILHDNNVKLILWQCPVIKYEKGNENEQHKIDEEYVINNKLCVFNDDGTPYRIPDNWFANSLIPDFTNPKTVEWWFNKREYLIKELKVDGFKTDGGEFIYDDSCVFYNGETGAEMRNQYPISYAKAYTNFIAEDRVLFSRAGYTGAGNYPLHWAGDKYSTFEEHRSVIIAGLSANISGIPFWGFDIGGFAGDLPSTELYIRSTQVATFSPIMQFHSEPVSSPQENNDRTPWNVAETNGDEIAIEVYRKYANIRMNILPYIYNEAIKVAEQGLAMMRPLFYDFSKDIETYNIETEYMFGENLLICAVTEEGAKEISLYLPEGDWTDLFTGTKYAGGDYINYKCPLEKIPVFIRKNCITPLNLNMQFELGGNIGNGISSYERLCFLINGDYIEGYTFVDDLGNEINIQFLNGEVEVKSESDIGEIHFIIAKEIELANMVYVKRFNEHYEIWKKDLP
ncbi:MAG: TIM-barrel domain-containing protein [Alkaliphilus sp.]